MKVLLKWLRFSKNRFASVRRGLRWLLYLAVVWVIIYEFYLVDIPEWFPKASVLGAITDKICFAYITAFIFFFVNIHLSGYTHKVKMYKYVRNKAELIRVISTTLMQNIKKASELDENSILGKEELIEISRKIDPREPIKSVGLLKLEFNNWFDYIDYIDLETKRLIKDLLFIRETLDADTLKILTDIEDCLTLHVNLTKGVYVDNINLEFWIEGIYNYLEFCQKLTKHLEKKYEGYSEEFHYIENKKGLKQEKQK
ncbi:hypothetical protein [Bacillus toyonensis]